MSLKNESKKSLLSEEDKGNFNILGRDFTSNTLEPSGPRARSPRAVPFHLHNSNLKRKVSFDRYMELNAFDDGHSAVDSEAYDADLGSEVSFSDQNGFYELDYDNNRRNVPAPELTQSGTSSIMKAVLNFTNSIVGAGIIGLPYAFAQAGFFFGIIMMSGLALLVDWTVCLLIKTSKLASTNSYQDLVEFCFGKRGLVLISIFQFLFAFGAMCAYSVIVGDTIPLVLRHFLGGEEILSPVVLFITSRRFAITLATLGVSLPLSLYRDISKLAKASAFAMGALFFILVVVLLQGPREENRANFELNFIKPTFLQAVGVISFAFVCHHNSFMIYGSLVKPSLNRWEIVTHLSTGISWILSMVMAFAGYLTFGAKTEANILNNFSDNNIWVNLSRLAFAANMFTTFPLECFVCREVIEHYYFRNQKISVQLHTIITL
jgi:solute carrier family 38 (sodium-coupled neutral amino acid transporter), member 11